LLIRQKGHWEALIIELGSPNYAKVGAKMTDLEGNEVDVPGATGKGPVTDTLGLQNSSLTSKRYSISPLKVKKRRSRYEIYKRIDASSYYGYKNDEDGILEKVEWPMEEEM
jgi:pre-mRNA-splicing factor ISY1